MSDNFYSEGTHLLYVCVSKLGAELSATMDSNQPLSSYEVEMMNEIDEKSAELIENMRVENAEHGCNSFDPSVLEKYGYFLA